MNIKAIVVSSNTYELAVIVPPDRPESCRNQI